MKDTYIAIKKYLFFVDPMNAWGVRHVTREIITILKNNNCKRVLDVCCGTGRLLKEIEKNGMDATGVDMSETMVDRARKKKRAKNLMLIDATKMDFTDKFDAAVILIALHEMDPETRKLVIENMKKVVKEGGVLIFSDFATVKNKSLSSKFNGYIIHKGEEAFLDSFPDHYNNYVEFMENGGIEGFLKNEKIISLNFYMGGTVGVGYSRK